MKCFVVMSARMWHPLKALKAPRRRAPSGMLTGLVAGKAPHIVCIPFLPTHTHTHTHTHTGVAGVGHGEGTTDVLTPEAERPTRTGEGVATIQTGVVWC